MKRLKLSSVAMLLLAALLLGAGCAPTRSFGQKVDAIVQPYRFSIVGWEIKTLLNGVRQNPGEDAKTEAETGKIADYFSFVERISGLKQEMLAVSSGFREGKPVELEEELSSLEEQRATLAGEAESILGKQIMEVLAEQGIYNPLGKSNNIFPLVNFKLEAPPHLLVISPRDRIENINNVLLRQDMNLKDMESIETKIEELGVSALVVGLGGLGTTYPTFVTSDADLRFTIDAATEEWLHQYLFFRPLGFRYFLDAIGIRPDYEISIMNETVAGMVSKEIGSTVYTRYYRKGEQSTDEAQKPPQKFDFNREMREIRKAVDDYLARGEIEQAEEFMELKREFLASKGYYIRKLNQAYFAFYGTYGDSPTSISPIGTEMKELRARSASLKEFLDTVSTMTSREDLKKVLGESQ